VEINAGFGMVLHSDCSPQRWFAAATVRRSDGSPQRRFAAATVHGSNKSLIINKLINILYRLFSFYLLL
jgi:hypothetical protein